MNIGCKIKALRMAKMLTQQELAGNMITRNMLSRIENGFALPSLPTLLYLADKLGVPAGYLLAEEDEEFQYKKIAGMPDIMRAYNAADWEICIDLCEKLSGFDDEIAFITAMCKYNEAKRLFVSGDLRQAVAMFESAKESGAFTSYPTENLMAECDTYLMCISAVSPLLVADTDIVSLAAPASLSDSFCRYFIMLRSIDEINEAVLDSKQVLLFNSDETVYVDHLRARLKMKSKYHTEAYHLLKGILSSNLNIPAPMLYFVFTDLEICCRELSDYRGAYEYSSDKTGMLEKFLG